MGLYLINKAQNEINELSQQSLIQKASIKKNLNKKINDETLKIKNKYFKTNDRFLNNLLTSNLLETNQNLLNLKKKLIYELKLDITAGIEKKIKNNYAQYTNYILNQIKQIQDFIDKPPEVVLIFNLKDYSSFSNSFKIKLKYFSNPVKIIKSEEGFIGGFKVALYEGSLSYNYTIDNTIIENSTIIENEFIKITSESKIKDIEKDFEFFIQNQKIGMEGYLKKYDRL